MERDVIFVLSIIVVFIILAIGMKVYQSQNSTPVIAINNTISVEEPKPKEGMKITIIGGSNMKINEDTNSMGYVIRTAEDKLILIDGGKAEDSNDILNYITKYGNGKVDYWFITHAHPDHAGALLSLIDNNNIEIENLCYNFLKDEWYKTNDKKGYETEHAMLEALNSEKIKNKIECYKDQVIDIDSVKCNILRIPNLKITNSDIANEISMIFKLTDTNMNKSIIFLGDSYSKTSEELLAQPENLSSFAVQMSHHGQNGVTKEVYDAINPSLCFFNCPEWLYNNDNGKGYNTGNWKTIEVRKWMEEKNTTNILAFEGDQTIESTNDGFKKVED